ncbi:hypothetical protein [Allobranchiibius sp. GilTou73]|uniref:hypothetical protein n=1 Tax=Allobranchiibius sp. GilTou73 TaxID=2904523 RepID=UPI001F3B0094|nr:hypothetical protein [Allobranchiibius sp. GilTou73]UIJ34938.1 hypothetical protein LVQ62_00545 [Allobranchiibius sp. GilTou73]
MDPTRPGEDTAANTPYVQNVTDHPGSPVHRDVIGEEPDGSLSLRRVGSSANVPVVGGGPCGVTVFEDGISWVALAPVPADSTSSVVLSDEGPVGFVSDTARLPSGQLVRAVIGIDGEPRNPVAYWDSPSRGYSSSTGERGHGIVVADTRVVVYPRSHLMSASADKGMQLSRIGSLPAVAGVAPNDREDTYLALLPVGAHQVSMQFDPPEGARATGQGPVGVVRVPGTSYDVAAVEHVPPEATGLSIEWVDSHGTLRHWAT